MRLESPTHKGGSVSACEHVCQWERVRKLGKDKNIRKINEHSQLGSLMLLVLQDWFKVWKTHWIKLFADFSCQLSRNHGIENLKSNVWETTGFLKITLGNFVVIVWLVLDRKYCPLYWKCEFWNFCPLYILGCMNLNWHIWLVILSWNIPCQHSIKSSALWTSTFMEVWKLKVTASYHQFLLQVGVLAWIKFTVHSSTLTCFIWILEWWDYSISWNCCPSGKSNPQERLGAWSIQTETPVRLSSCQGSWSMLDHAGTTCFDISKAYFNCMFFTTHTHTHISINYCWLNRGCKQMCNYLNLSSNQFYLGWIT